MDNAILFIAKHLVRIFLIIKLMIQLVSYFVLGLVPIITLNSLKSLSLNILKFNFVDIFAAQLTSSSLSNNLLILKPLCNH